MSLRLLAVLALLTQTPAANGVIVGSVTDSTGGVVPGVAVTAVLDLYGATSRQVVTGTNGRYRLEGLAAGRYRIEVSLAGFETIRKENIVVSDDAQTLDFKLMVAARGPGQDAVHADLIARVDKITGSSPKDCGDFTLRMKQRPTVEQLQTAVDCGLAAAGSHEPFRAVQQLQGVDSIVYSGFFAGPNGVIYAFNYDSAPCGNPGGCEPRFNFYFCTVPTVRVRPEYVELGCGK